ncbi:MAG: Glu-tRNA(Gln) amidotransferase subunit GatE [Nitrososphaeraceae archaeon]
MENNHKEIHVKVGFEIHQQLSTKHKLFCNCICQEEKHYDFSFQRKLRPTQSELGEYDQATIFEYKKMQNIKYYSSYPSSCLVEADEEPPHNINKEAIETALIISLALHSKIVDEIHVMRKIVIDGSNTSGFQRTMLISFGGYIEVHNKKIKVQSICLEEDSSKLISNKESNKEYGLDRLGIPLIEIALEPVSSTPEEIVQVTHTLGRLLRASKRVTRGLGSIRQDVNISINNSNGIVEVKGVQQLDQLTKIIDYEIKRQHALLLLSEKFKQTHNKINERDLLVDKNIQDITQILKNCNSSLVKKILDNDKNVFNAIKIKNFKGYFKYEPYKDIRLGKELGQLVRFYGFGGLFHSDELPNYGITNSEINKINQLLEIKDNDAFIILGGSRNKISVAIDALYKRLSYVKVGVPSETRSATIDGKTIYSRPKPGASRMYPETDIPPFKVTKQILEKLNQQVPKPWNEIINTISKKYNLNKKLAESIFDSVYFDIFEKLTQLTTNISSTFIASKLIEDIVSLERQGYDPKVLTDDIILDIFTKLDSNNIAKESIYLIFEKLMKKEAKNVQESIHLLGIRSLSDTELNNIIDKILNDNKSIIEEKREKALNTLMGKSMSILRGKVHGEKINSIIKQKLNRFLSQ